MKEVAKQHNSFVVHDITSRRAKATIRYYVGATHRLQTLRATLTRDDETLAANNLPLNEFNLKAHFYLAAARALRAHARGIPYVIKGVRVVLGEKKQ